ncbi:hypothetical protein Q7P35_003488 [Cladosporium inversicolor]
MTHQALQYHVKELGEVKSAPCRVGSSNSQVKRRANGAAHHVLVSHYNTAQHHLVRSAPYHPRTLPPTPSIFSPRSNQRRSPPHHKSRASSNTTRHNIALLFSMSAAESTTATVAANTTPKPKGFFSLPRELRDEIYDIIHRQEVESELGQLVFRFCCPLFHIRLINRRLTTEFDMRTPDINRAQLVVSHRLDPMWYPSKQPHYLPEFPTCMTSTRLTQLEFKFHVSDCYKEIYTEMWWFHRYSEWIGRLLGQTPRLYVSNLEPLMDLISNFGWYARYCTKISLVLLEIPEPTPTMKMLGLYIYSDTPQTLAIWEESSGWRVDKAVSRQAQTEENAEGEVEEIDWTAFEDGNYHGMEGSGWDVDESAIEQSRDGWDSGGEGPSVDDGHGVQV